MTRTGAAIFLGLLTLLPVAQGAVPVGGQCGGKNYNGSKTCVTRSSCVYENAAKSVCRETATKYWFSFGDSYTDTGFSATGTLPSISNPMGNPPYPGSTICGHVPNWLGSTTALYGNNTALKVFNHARSSATINATLVPVSAETLDDQVGILMQYEAQNKETVPWTGANALFSIWIGINDIGKSYHKTTIKNHIEFNDVLMDAYFREVEAIYNVGGRQFLFLNVPPMERSPENVNGNSTNKAFEASVIADYNKKLVARAAEFQKSHSGSSTHVYDAHTKISWILNDPAKYGFYDATRWGHTNDVWCNNYHIGPATGALVAADVGKILKSIHFFN